MSNRKNGGIKIGSSFQASVGGKVLNSNSHGHGSSITSVNGVPPSLSTGIQNKEVNSGYNKPDVVNSGISTLSKPLGSGAVGVSRPTPTTPLVNGVPPSLSTGIQNKEVNSGYNKPDVVNSGISTLSKPLGSGAVGVSRPTPTTPLVNGVPSSLRTGIQNKEVNSGYNKPDVVNSGISTLSKPLGSGIGKVNPLKTFKSESVGNNIISGFEGGILSRVIRTGKRNLIKSDDSSSATISMGVDSSIMAFKSYRFSIKASTTIERASLSVGHKVKTATRNADRIYGMVKSGHISVRQATKLTLASLKESVKTGGLGVVKSAYKKLPLSAKFVATGAYLSGKLVFYSFRPIVQGAILGKPSFHHPLGLVNRINFLNSFVNGSVKIGISKAQFQHFIKIGFKKSGIVGGRFIKTGLKGGLNVSIGVAGLGSRFLQGSNDSGLQAVDIGLKSVHATKYAPKIYSKSYNGVKTGVKATYNVSKGVTVKTIKTGKGIANAIKMFKKSGGKAAFTHYRVKFANNVRNRFAKMGKNLMKLISKVFNALKTKVVLPLILVAAIVAFLMNITSVPIQGVSSLFGGICTDGDTGMDIDTHAWLINKVAAKRTEFVTMINQKYNNYLKPSGQYDIVRLYSSRIDSGVTVTSQFDLTDTNITSSIWTVDEYCKIIEPVFYSILMSKYDLEPTQSEMDTVFDDIWNTITIVTDSEEPTEYCEGVHACGIRHANVASCYNYTAYNHGDDHYTCDRCCYYYWICKGHKGSLNCGKEAHTHSNWVSLGNPGCYSRNLVCTTPVHVHSSCYSLILTCTTTPSVTHSHNSACYLRVLTCSTSHTHTDLDACQASVLNCATNHTHTSTCFVHVNICQNINASHVHQNNCYDAWRTCTNNSYTHSHTAACYKRTSTVVCGFTAHSHSVTSPCYALVLSCGKEPHTHSNWVNASNPGCYSTDYHSGELSSPCTNSVRHSRCNGYYVCNGHKIMGITILAEQYDTILNKYFLNEINYLKGLPSLTNTQRLNLESLQDSYDFCVAYQSTIDYNFGTGTAVIPYDDCTLDNLTMYACSFVGYPYQWGGTNLMGGIDCSGFTQAVFYDVLGIVLPHSSQSQSGMGTSVSSIGSAKGGDLIFYRDSGGSVHHVAIFIGNGKVVHASNSRPYPDGGIKVSNVTDSGTNYFIKRFY